jgi:hypothetical protein
MKFIGMDFAFAKSGLAILDENANIISEWVIVTTPIKEEKPKEEITFNKIIG